MSDTNRKTKRSLLSFNFLLVTLSGFIFFFNFHSLLLLPIHIKTLGGSETTIGFLMGTAGVSTLVTTPAVGYLGDRLGKKIFVTAGLLILSLTTIALSTVNNTGLLYYLLRLSHGFAFSLFFVSAGTIITDIAPEDKRAQAVGLYGVFTIVNYALAPYFGRILINNYGFLPFFLITGSITFCAVPLIFFLRTTNGTHLSYGQTANNYMNILSSENVLVPAVTLLTAGAAFIPTLTFIPVFSDTIGIKSFDNYFILYTASILFIRIFCGWLPDTYGKSYVAKPSLFLFSGSIMILSISQDMFFFLLSALLFGISHGFGYPSLYSIVIDNAGSTNRTKAFAICSLSFTAGGMFGTFISGIIADTFGYTIMYLFIAALAMSAFLIFAGFYDENLNS